MAKYSETNYKQFQYKLEPARHKKPARRSVQNSIKSLSNFPITTKCCSCSHYPNHVWINSQLGFILSYSIFNWHYLPFYSAVPMTCHTQHSAKIIVATVSRTSRKSVNGRGNQPTSRGTTGYKYVLLQPTSNHNQYHHHRHYPRNALISFVAPTHPMCVLLAKAHSLARSPKAISHWVREWTGPSRNHVTAKYTRNNFLYASLRTYY